MYSMYLYIYIYRHKAKISCRYSEFHAGLRSSPSRGRGDPGNEVGSTLVPFLFPEPIVSLSRLRETMGSGNENAFVAEIHSQFKR